MPNVLTNALIPMRYYVTLNTLLGISRVTLHITTLNMIALTYPAFICAEAISVISLDSGDVEIGIRIVGD